MSTTVHHINCGSLRVPSYPRIPCHCLLIDASGILALVDAGIGMLDVLRPEERLGRPLIEMAGFVFDEADTAVRRVEEMGYRPEDVSHIVLTHGDPDHAGGLADFPQASVHLSAEEGAAIDSGNPRYVPVQFAHRPRLRTYPASASRRWFGLEARPVNLGPSAEVLLVPLFGHTHGHCGVAIRQGGCWALHVGDADYLRLELETEDHPVSQLAAQRADDDPARRASLEQLRRLARDHADEIDLFNTHDPRDVTGRPAAASGT